MFGILVTLVAAWFVVCAAFCYTSKASAQDKDADFLFSGNVHQHGRRAAAIIKEK